jgi:hypothetical protein
MLESFFKTWLVVLKGWVEGIPIRAPKSLYRWRYRRCQECPYLLRIAGIRICSDCGCILRIKSALLLADCREGRWKLTD